jgi:hypothetical protein
VNLPVAIGTNQNALGGFTQQLLYITILYGVVLRVLVTSHAMMKF